MPAARDHMLVLSKLDEADVVCAGPCRASANPGEIPIGARR